MDQQHNLPSPELPRPERISPQNESGDFVVPYPEQVGQAPVGERISQASQAVAQAQSATVADPAVIPVVDPAVTQQSAQGLPPVADDVDVIEKEWVEKAKTIVEQTKADPHQQSAALSTFKNDYMKKRYGKEIKQAE
ncbi:MAG: hypothetical protein U0491_00085 [Candidatus Saccharimonadales bacterium]